MLSYMHTYLHTHTQTHTSSLCPLTQTWRTTQSCPHGWHWAQDNSRGGRHLGECREAGPHCFLDHPSQRGQQSDNAPYRLHDNPHHHSRHPGPAMQKTNSKHVILHILGNFHPVPAASVSKASSSQFISADSFSHPFLRSRNTEQQFLLWK